MRLGLAALFASFVLLSLDPTGSAADAPDYDLPNGIGHFYRQANGAGGQGENGFSITNADGIPFWDLFRQLGGVDTLGYPASRRFIWNGFVVQAMQKVVLQWRPESGAVAFVNVLDQMHDGGQDGWLQSFRQTPPPFDTTPDTDLTWGDVTRRHSAFLDTNAAVQARYWADPAPIDHFGLPMSYADEGNNFTVRAQRAVLQYWKVDVSWATQGQVTIANAGDLAKEVGLIPQQAATPESPPGAAPEPVPDAGRSHDWRSTGYVAAIGGQLYDPRCTPLRSIGANAPNLPYRIGLTENLEWLRQNHFRWLRVFATGHSLGPDRAPRNAAAAITALGALLSRCRSLQRRARLRGGSVRTRQPHQLLPSRRAGGSPGVRSP